MSEEKSNSAESQFWENFSIAPDSGATPAQEVVSLGGGTPAGNLYAPRLLASATVPMRRMAKAVSAPAKASGGISCGGCSSAIHGSLVPDRL